MFEIFNLGGGYRIELRKKSGRGAEILSNISNFAEGNKELKCALDGFESMVLSCCDSGIGVDSTSFKEAMQSSFDAIINQYGE